MPQTLDPLATAERIDADYRSYLTTTFAPVDPTLRAAFEAAINEPHRTRKGPILQATPPYASGASIRELVADGVLHHDFLAMGQTALPPDRPLYAHQERSLRMTATGKNSVIATGTGSGKTECYLLPVLNHLLHERSGGTLQQPGVRALLLYPMNALANDQMKRIRALFAPYPDISFGRYTGETESDPDKALAKYRQQLRHEPPPGEYIDRATMQQTPPHVLLTNFAMLEYLLLRPADSTLFDGPTGNHWQYIVLDEVHVYDGAKGAEVSMLLRRVRDRVNGTQRGKLICIGTSATLGRGEQDSDAVAEFASALFDEEYDADGVVHPERLPLQQTTSSWTIDDHQLNDLHRAWLDGADAEQLVRLTGRSHSQCDDVPTTLWQLLHDEQHVIELQRRLEARSHDLAELHDIFPDAANPAGLIVQLVDLCIAARHDATSAPLVPARYHLWIRASEGAFVCLHPEHDHRIEPLRLDRHLRCPACAQTGRTAQMFELAVCRHCRTSYVIGALVDDRLEPVASFERNLVHLLIGAADDSDEDTDEDETAVTGDVEHSSDRAWLCAGCGALSATKGSCGCSALAWIAVTMVGSRRASTLKRCAECKRHSPNGVVQRFLSGSEAPVAVVATSLYQSLPPVVGAGRRAIAEGRKLLMFSDSRQDAAFFAPYLSRTYGRALERRMVWRQLSADPEPFLFGDLISPIRADAERSGVLDEDDTRSNNDEVARWLMAELLATDRRQSLDGLGLAEIVARLPRKFDPPASLLELGLSGDEAFDVVRVLLDSIRLSAAVSVPDTVDVKSDLRFAPRNTTTFVRGSHSEPGVLAWVPGRGQNRRSDYLSKLVAARHLTADVPQLLRQIWDDLTEPDGPLQSVLRPHDVRNLGVVFALNHERIEFAARGEHTTPHRCSRCQVIWWRSVAAVCPTYRCDGALRPLRSLDRNHYSSLYDRLDPIPLTVQEHTGQLRPSHAADLQSRFTRGELNALSCSTTFELGVDVGEVQAVLMRNVPPSPANYVQRAGRAGRRLGSAALVVSFAQRRSHDRAFFDHPDRMVDGVIDPPIVVADNDAIVRRHIHSVAWAQFERERVDRGGEPVRTLLELIGDDKSVADQLIEWLSNRPSSLREACERIVPENVRDTVGIANWEWVQRLLEPDEDGVGGWLSGLIQQTLEERRTLQELEEAASVAKNHPRAGALQRTRRTLDGRRAIDVLAQRGILPKYGFPVDVVDLDVSQSLVGAQLDLNRDLRLGILEFAPGAKVVAANKLWVSKGMRRISGRELPMYEWGVCAGCGVLRTAVAGGNSDESSLNSPCAHCSETGFAAGQRSRFVQPLFGFVGDLASDQPGEQRPPREGYLETYFAEFDGPPPAIERIELGGRPFHVRSSRRGWITVFNRGKTGRGFSYCSRCGYATDEMPRRRRDASGGPPTHQPPRGGSRECTGTLYRADLGHRYITNVLELDLPVADHRAPPSDAALSALHSLIAAAPTIGIAQNDLGGSPSVGVNGQPTVVLFDDVPGGAGHTRHVREHLAQLFAGAISRLEECTCGEDTSCYGCLRSFRNQQVHDDLTRGAALDVLRSVVRPQPLQAHLELT